MLELLKTGEENPLEVPNTLVFRVYLHIAQRPVVARDCTVLG